MLYQFIRIFVFFLIMFSLNGCLGHGNFKSFVEMQDKAIKDKHKINYTWIEDHNNELNPYQVPKLTSYDLDSLPIIITSKNDGRIQINRSFAAVGVYGRYYIYYNIIDKKTNQYIDWNFVYCDKNKIDLDDDTTYNKCLKDTRLTRESNGVYRIGVSRIFRSKYGYEINEIATKKDNLQMVRDVLNENNTCLDSNINIIQTIHVRAGGIRYMLECRKTRGQ